MEDSCREYSYSKNEETRLKIFQLSERWDSVENFSPWNNTTSWKFLHWKPMSTGSLPSLPHAPASISFLLPWGTLSAKVPSTRRWQHSGKAGLCWEGMELVLVPSARPKRSELEHVQGGCSGAHGGRCFITLLPFTTAAFPLINPPRFVLALSERLFRLPAQLILSPSPVSSFLFPHRTNSLTAES